MARPQKIPRETLLEMLRQFRSEGMGAKAIARGLGYSKEHVYKLCAQYRIRKTVKTEIRNSNLPRKVRPSLRAGAGE